MKHAKGVRLKEFCKIGGWQYEWMRAMHAREQAPYFVEVEPGTRRLYTGAELFAMKATEMLVACQKLSWAAASDRVLMCSAVNDYFGMRDQGQKVDDMFLVITCNQDKEPSPMLISGSRPITSIETLANYLKDPDICSIAVIRMHKAYQDAEKAANEAGYILAGRDLVKAPLANGEIDK